MEQSAMIEYHYPIPQGYLNIAELYPATKVLGPGKRFVLWMQGCRKKCENCGSPEWRIIKPATIMTPEEVSILILKTNEIEGITLSGGEPILQAEGLVRLIELVKKKRDLSVICFTGYTLEELKECNNTAIHKLIHLLDVLIDGPYTDELNDNKGLRGSNNQNIHFLTPRYRDKEKKFYNWPREREIVIKDQYDLHIGIESSKNPC